MIVIGTLFIFKGFGSGRPVELSQSRFEQMLNLKQIAKATLTSEGDNVFSIEGVLVSNSADAKQEPPRKFHSRVIYNSDLNRALLQNTEIQVDSNNAGVWNFVLFGLMPVLIIVGIGNALTRNPALVRALEARSGRPCRIPDLPEMAACGVAFWTMERELG